MSNVDPFLEERLNLFGQDIDQFLCEMENRLAVIKSHRRRPLVDRDKPVNDEQIERGDRNSSAVVVREESLTGHETEITAEGQEEEEETPSVQRAREPQSGPGLARTPGNATTKATRQQEQSRGEARGVNTPDLDEPVPSGAGGVTIWGPETQSSSKKDPPWPPVPPLTDARTHVGLPDAASAEVYVDIPCRREVSVHSAGKVGVDKVTTEQGAMVGESPGSGNRAG